MVQFKSFEETLVLIGALATAGIAYMVFNATARISILIGALSAAAIIYATLSEFTLQDDIITYQNGPVRFKA